MRDTKNEKTNSSTGAREINWALILGGSKGLGLATAKKLASKGFGLLIVHRDLRTDLPVIKQDFGEIESMGVPLHSFNADAIKDEKRKDLLLKIAKALPQNQKISVVVHSIAKGHLKPMLEDGNTDLSGTDLQITIQAMAISLYDWTKALFDLKLLAHDTRIIAYTSQGSSRVMKYYAAVSAAKSALESIVRSIALEFASHGIKANCIQAGVTDTASFKRIPNSDKILAKAAARNPSGRATKPDDVANVAYLLCTDEANWITGSIIKADGGESLI